MQEVERSWQHNFSFKDQPMPVLPRFISENILIRNVRPITVYKHAVTYLATVNFFDMLSFDRPFILFSTNRMPIRPL
jgi:hypothetical protein